MLTAIFAVHFSGGFLAPKGYEYPFTLAGAALAGACLLGQWALLGGFDHFRLAEKIFGLFTVIFVAAGVFFAVCYFLRFEEMQEAVGLVTRRLRRRPGRGR